SLATHLTRRYQRVPPPTEAQGGPHPAVQCFIHVKKQKKASGPSLERMSFAPDTPNNPNLQNTP
ncbi:hypothetical protein LZ189_16605, partial [Rhodovulum sulfidophilum]|nr:hypothetical protein [Rhodovulum sulfidophilum]